MRTLASLLRISALVILFTALFWAYATIAQTETGTISGLITDETGAAVAGAEVQLLNVQRGTTSDAKTNSAGIYVFTGVQPGQYQIKVQKPGFKQVDLLSLIVNVQDHIEQNVRLQVGSVSESVTVNADDIHINTEDASVSTVIDRNFAENLPLNGRSFQSLIYLAPGVVPVAGGGTNSGQFSVNGQRTDSNYWSVDGVSANVGSNTLLSGQQMGGAIGTTSVLGSTNSLVSVDALQEFRVQTSSFAPEYGRTPGAQISIVTRSGTNSFHGSLFEYLRNDLFDANDWFNGVNWLNPTPLPKSRERQNDFGGTFGGPILKNRTFFFFSYEGLRLRLPATGLTDVPCDATCSVFGNARAMATAPVQPFLNAFPLPNGPEVFVPCQAGTPGCPASGQMSTGTAEFNASYVNPATLDVFGLRLDHKLTDKITAFVRYNLSPSSSSQRGVFEALSHEQVSETSAQQLTGGLAWILTPRLLDEFRINWSKTDSSSTDSLDTFHGAIPLPVSALSLPSPFTLGESSFTLGFNLSGNPLITIGPLVRNVQMQFNVTDSLSWSVGSHSLKIGVDYRRLTPVFAPGRYSRSSFFNDMATALVGGQNDAIVQQFMHATLLVRNFSAFAQDTWHVTPRLTTTYGARWDVNARPTAISGPPLPAYTGFQQIDDLSQLALAPLGTPVFKTSFGNVAPRLGVAYELSPGNWGTVARGAFGVFYDMVGSELGSVVGNSNYPYNSTFVGTLPQFPLSPQEATPPPIQPPTQGGQRQTGWVPNFKAPYTLEWNAGIDQGLGQQQSVSILYVGGRGRRLTQPIDRFPDPNLPEFRVLSNAGYSSYDALQVQFQRRPLKNLQVLSSYTWSHSIDTASGGTAGVGSDTPGSTIIQQNRASSDFDIRHAFSAGLTYSLPSTNFDPVLRKITHGWSLQSTIQVQSARPVSVLDGLISRTSGGLQADIRPDLVPGIPLYLYGGQYPGGRAFNNTVAPGACPDGSDRVGAFCPPPTVFTADGVQLAVRQGNFPRNGLRGFGLFQWNLGIHREFPIHESLVLQFRAEMFNLPNHPNFGPPIADISFPQGFGLPAQTLGNYLAGSFPGAGGLDSLYQIGGPRSIQFALKLAF